FQAEDGIRDRNVTGVQTCALPICDRGGRPDDTDLPVPLRTQRVDMRVVLVDPVGLHLTDVGVCGDVVSGQVVVDHVPEPVVQHAVLVQRHRQPHGHATGELRSCRARVDDPADGEHTQQPWHPDLTRGGVDGDLCELCAVGVHCVLTSVRIGLYVPLCLVTVFRTRTELLPELVRGVDNGRSPGCGSCGTARQHRVWIVGVADTDLDVRFGHAERIRSDLT